MMQVAAHIEPHIDPVGQPDGRRSPRWRANLMASLRQRKQSPEMIKVSDISPDGCGFRSRWESVRETRPTRARGSYALRLERVRRAGRNGRHRACAAEPSRRIP